MKSHRSAVATLLASAALAGACAGTASAQVLSINASATVSTAALDAAREFVVAVNIAGMTGAVGAQATVAYDPAVVEFVGLAAGDDFTTLIYSNHDAVAHKIVFASGIDQGASGAGISAGNAANLTFRTIVGACSDLDAVVFSTSALPTRITDGSGASLSHTESNAVSVTALSPFTLVGGSADTSVATDAGSIIGAFVTLVSPTASDSCATTLTVTASRSDSAAIGAEFPIGTTTVTYSATDAAGNTDSSDVLVTVANYQLLDAAITLNGAILGDSSRSIRVTTGASSQVTAVAFTAGVGAASNLHVPVAASYGCVSAKDVGHSLSNSAAASIVGVEYSTSIALDQGDSNDDNLVDILDFGIFIGDFGPAAAGGISNFNDDLSVNNADYGFISLNFAHTGITCGAFTGGAPRTAVSVKELRRLGLGHLVSADLNRDGMVNISDIVYYMEHGVPSTKRPIVTTQW